MLKCVLCIVLFIFSLASQAKEIYYGSVPELVSVSEETIFRFHKQVRTISQAQRFEIKPADPNNPDYSVLSIRPRFTRGTSKVAFVLSDGNVVTLKLRIVKKTSDSVEPFYDLKPKNLLIKKSEQNLPAITVMDFMRSIDRDDNIVGYERRVENKRLYTRRGSGLRAKLIRTYKGRKYKGFVIELRNRSTKNTYKIEVDELKFKGSPLAIISLVDDKVLYPRGKGPNKTLLKVVSKPTAFIRDLILPVSVRYHYEKKGQKI